MGLTAIRAAVAGVFAVATAAGAATTNVLLAEILGSWQGDSSLQFVELAITQDGSTDVSGGTGPECLMEWKITNGSHRPGADGDAPVRQVCTDGDPACDADDVTGTCTFTVAVCFDVDDARFTKNGKACRHAPIARWSIVRATGTGAEPIVDSAGDAVAAMAPSMIDGNTITFAPPLGVEGGCSEPISAVVASGRPSC